MATTDEGGLNGKSSRSAAGDVLRSVLAQKGRLASHKGEIVPSALPQNLLPLLGRGLSITSLPGHPLEHQSGGILSRVRPPASAAVSGQGSHPSETQAHTHGPEQEDEITTQATMQDVDAEAPSSGTSKHV